MSDYMDETSSTPEGKANGQRPNRSRKPNNYYNRRNRHRSSRPNPKPVEEESADDLFSEIDSASEQEELSPEYQSGQSYSNAFAEAKSKREEELKKRKFKNTEAEDEDEADEDFEYDSEDESPEEDVPEKEQTEDSEEYEEEYQEEDEETVFETDDEDEDVEYVDFDEEDEDDSENVVFDADESNEYDSEDAEDGDYEEDLDDIAESDEEDEEYEESEEDNEDDDKDEDDSAFSTKTKVIIGVVIAILVLAIIGAGIFFLSKGKEQPKEPTTSAAPADGSVTSIKFAEPSLNLRVGETSPLEIVIEPKDAKDKVLKLKSNDPAIAKVDEQGKVTGVSSGSTTINATLKSNEAITASLIVNVIDEEQNTLNIYNKFVNSVIDGSTDIDSDTETDTDSETEEETEGEDTDTEKDTDTDTRKVVVKNVLTGSLIEDIDSDGEMELALMYKGENDGTNVRFFHLVDPNAVEEEPKEEEPKYDEYGNLIEEEETDTASDSDKAADKQDGEKVEKVVAEVDKDSELYTTLYSTLEEKGANWNTCYLEIKEGETSPTKVDILSKGYESPSYVFESEDQTVATVDSQGNIKGVKPGNTFVIVTSPLNSEAMAKIKVRIKDDTDLLDDYLAKIPVVNSTNDPVFPTETLTGKAIVDLDGDGISELLLRFDYGSNVETINMVKVENEKCVVYKTYNNISDLYEYSEGKGYYNNTILVHYTTGKVCMEYKGVVSKEDSKTKTSEQKILSVEEGGKLSELINFKTTTDITTKTVTSEVAVDNTTTSSSDDTSSVIDEDSDVWYEDSDEDTDSESVVSEDESNEEDDYGYEASYAQLTFDEIADGGIDLVMKKAAKKVPEAAAAPDDEEDNDYDYDNDNDNDDDNGDDDTSSETSSKTDNDDTNTNDDDTNTNDDGQSTSTVTSEITEETTKYFVNGSPVEQSVYEEFLATYSARYSVWSAWESVDTLVDNAADSGISE